MSGNRVMRRAFSTTRFVRGGRCYEATCAAARKCEDGQWRIPRGQWRILRKCEGGEEAANLKLLAGYHLLDLAGPELPNYFGDAAARIAAGEESEAL
jgi:hypothetical protein